MDWDENSYRPPSPPPWQTSEHPEVKLRMLALDLEHLRETSNARFSAKARLLQACQDPLKTDEQRLGGHQDRLTEIAGRVDRNADAIAANSMAIAGHDKRLTVIEETTSVVGEVSMAVKKFIQGRNIILAAVIVWLLSTGRLSPDAVAKWLGIPGTG